MQKVYNVCEFGAVGDGKTLNSRAVQAAVDACAKAGGGTVLFPPGTYKAGSVRLRSNITIQLAKGATLLQSNELKDFTMAPRDSYVHCTGSHRAFLRGVHVSNVTIVGPGIIDGNKGDRVPGRDPRGPLPVIFENSQDITLRDVTVRNSPGWSITFWGCQRVRLLRVKCISSFADGINPVCCRDVLYDGVLVDHSGDDAITIKNEGRAPAYGYLSENIVVRNTTVRNTGHPAVKLGTGTFGVFRNILVEHCNFENVGAMFTIQLMRPKKKETLERAIKDITFSDIKVNNVSRLLDITSLDVSRPIIRNIRVENITVNRARQPSFIYGLPGAPISNFTLSNITHVVQRHAIPFWLKARHVRGLKLHDIRLDLARKVGFLLLFEDGSGLELDHVRVEGVAGREPAVQLSQAKGALIKDCAAPGVHTFVYAGGKQTGDIKFAGNDFEGVETPFAARDDVAANAVSTLAKKVSYTDMSVSRQIGANEGFKVDFAVTNNGAAGALKAQVRVNGEVAGSKWLWLRTGETSRTSILTREYYNPGTYELALGPLAAQAVVRPSPAAFEFGDVMEIVSPAQPGQLTSVKAAVKNIGASKGDKRVELYADGKPVAFKDVSLAPGEKADITLAHRFGEPGPHRLKLDGFPEWPFATFANTEAHFYLTRDGRIIIEAGGGRHYIWSDRREYAAAYLRGVKRDFVAKAAALRQRVTGPYCGGGIIVKNDMTKPRDSSGCAVSWSGPKYNVVRFETPMTFSIEKRSGVLKGSKLRLVSPKDAAAAQDVGLFATAFSTKGEMCRVEFEQFVVERK